MRAHRGEVVYRDWGSDWSAVARNLDVTVSKLVDYRGQLRFSNSTITIQSYVPMTAALEAAFHVEGTQIVFDQMALVTDGAVSDVTGRVDIGNWPEQIYHVRSRVQFPRMREIFFAGDSFSLHGEGEFAGTFHLFKGAAN